MRASNGKWRVRVSATPLTTWLPCALMLILIILQGRAEIESDSMTLRSLLERNVQIDEDELLVYINSALRCPEEHFEICGLPVANGDLGLTMKKGWFRAAEAVLDLAVRGGRDLEGEMLMESRMVQGRLKELSRKLSANRSKTRKSQTEIIVSPALQWCQGRDYVHLEAKLAHKLDAPAALGFSTSVSIERSRVLIEAVKAGQPRVFRLDLDLYAYIQPEESSWAPSSAGRLTLKLKKEEPKRWSQLFSKHSSAPPALHLWLGKAEELERELSDLEWAQAKEKSTSERSAGDVAHSVTNNSEHDNAAPRVSSDQQNEGRHENTRMDSASKSLSAAKERGSDGESNSKQSPRDRKTTTDEGIKHDTNEGHSDAAREGPRKAPTVDRLLSRKLALIEKNLKKGKDKVDKFIERRKKEIEEEMTGKRNEIEKWRQEQLQKMKSSSLFQRLPKLPTVPSLALGVAAIVLLFLIVCLRRAWSPVKPSPSHVSVKKKGEKIE